MKHEYPKFLYHAKHEEKIVHSKEEHEKLGSGWQETPVEKAAPKQEASKGKKNASESVEG